MVEVVCGLNVGTSSFFCRFKVSQENPGLSERYPYKPLRDLKNIEHSFYLILLPVPFPLEPFFQNKRFFFQTTGNSQVTCSSSTQNLQDFAPELGWHMPFFGQLPGVVPE